MMIEVFQVIVLFSVLTFCLLALSVHNRTRPRVSRSGYKPSPIAYRPTIKAR